MQEGPHKEGARCKYHDMCSLYNLDILSPPAQYEMCGRGQPVDSNYEPRPPVPRVPSLPSQTRHSEVCARTCDAYRGYELENVKIDGLEEATLLLYGVYCRVFAADRISIKAADGLLKDMHDLGL